MVALPVAGALPGIAGAGASSIGGLGAMGVGMAGSAVAGYFGMQAEQGVTQASQNIAKLQEQANQVNYNTARLSIRRNQMQELRNAQQSRSLALAAGVAQGAQFGSGVQGGYGNVSGEAGNTLLGLNQNLSSAGQMFDINKSISDQEIAKSGYQGTANMWQGIGQMAGGLGSAGGSVVNASTNPSGAQNISGS